MVAATVLHQLVRRADTDAQRPAYRVRRDSVWHTTDWKTYERETREVAKGLLELGVRKGDVVAILGGNRPEWVISALAVMRIGAVATGIYATDAPAEVGYILHHAEAKVIVVEDADQLAKVEAIWAETPTLTATVTMEGDPVDDDRVLSWDELVERGAARADQELDRCLDQLELDDLCDLIYTSGTTGPPKAVMLTHDNLRWTASMLADVAGMNATGTVLSYLPLSHIAEQMSSIHIAVMAGYVVNFCDEPELLNEYLVEVQPTYFFGVPRVWERIQAGVTGRLGEAEGMRARLIAWARRVGRRATDIEDRGSAVPLGLRLQLRLAHELVFAKIREALGMRRTERMISAAAPLPLDTLEFFASLHMPIHELYGQSEGSGPTTTNLPGATKLGTVGRPLPGVDVRLADDGEILFRGRNVFAGYLHDPDTTARTLDGGWVHSGDLGEIDDDGYLRITGRAKDIIITSGGKNIAPRPIEDALRSLDLVSEAVCVGDGRRYLVALVTLDPVAAEAFAVEHGIEPAEVASSPVLRGRLGADITSTVNSRFARVEHIRNVAVLADDFSIENRDLTPTLKVRRAAIIEKYASEIDALYAEGQVL